VRRSLGRSYRHEAGRAGAGSDGYADTNHDDDGHDAGLGEGGADWWEGPHVWRAVDWRENSDRLGQNKLAQDPSVGHYRAGEGVRVLNSSGSVTVASGSTLQMSGVTSILDGDVNLRGINSSDYVLIDAGKLAIGNFVSPTIVSESLHQVGWLSSGAWDTSQQKFVPLGLNAEQRREMRHIIVQLPKGWKVGEMIPGGNDVVYYRVSQDGVTVQSVASLGSTFPGTITLDPNGDVIGKYTYFGDMNLDGVVDQNDYQILASSDALVTVPTPDGGTAQVPSSTPGLYDGVKGQYRFLAVKRGTVILSGAGSESDVKQWDWTSQILALPTEGDVRIAGDAAVHTLASTFAHVPTAVPAGARGILVNDGALWLPGDGSAATFTAA